MPINIYTLQNTTTSDTFLCDCPFFFGDTDAEVRIPRLDAQDGKASEKELLALLLQGFNEMRMGQQNEIERSKFDVSLLETLATMVQGRCVRNIPEIHQFITSILRHTNELQKRMDNSCNCANDMRSWVEGMHSAPASSQFLQTNMITCQTLTHFIDAYSHQCLSHLMCAFKGSIENENDALCKIVQQNDAMCRAGGSSSHFVITFEGNAVVLSDEGLDTVLSFCRKPPTPAATEEDLPAAAEDVLEVWNPCDMVGCLWPEFDSDGIFNSLVTIMAVSDHDTFRAAITALLKVFCDVDALTVAALQAQVMSDHEISKILDIKQNLFRAIPKLRYSLLQIHYALSIKGEAAELKGVDAYHAAATEENRNPAAAALHEMKDTPCQRAADADTVFMTNNHPEMRNHPAFHFSAVMRLFAYICKECHPALKGGREHEDYCLHSFGWQYLAAESEEEVNTTVEVKQMLRKLHFPRILKMVWQFDDERGLFPDELLRLKRETFRVARYFCIDSTENQSLLFDFVHGALPTLLRKQFGLTVGLLEIVRDNRALIEKIPYSTIAYFVMAISKGLTESSSLTKLLFLRTILQCHGEYNYKAQDDIVRALTSNDNGNGRVTPIQALLHFGVKGSIREDDNSVSLYQQMLKVIQNNAIFEANRVTAAGETDGANTNDTTRLTSAARRKIAHANWKAGGRNKRGVDKALPLRLHLETVTLLAECSNGLVGSIELQCQQYLPLPHILTVLTDQAMASDIPVQSAYLQFLTHAYIDVDLKQCKSIMEYISLNAMDQFWQILQDLLQQLLDFCEQMPLATASQWKLATDATNMYASPPELQKEEFIFDAALPTLNSFFEIVFPALSDVRQENDGGDFNSGASEKKNDNIRSKWKEKMTNRLFARPWNPNNARSQSTSTAAGETIQKTFCEHVYRSFKQLEGMIKAPRSVAESSIDSWDPARFTNDQLFLAWFNCRHRKMRRGMYADLVAQCLKSLVAAIPEESGDRFLQELKAGTHADAERDTAGAFSGCALNGATELHALSRRILKVAGGDMSMLPMKPEATGSSTTGTQDHWCSFTASLVNTPLLKDAASLQMQDLSQKLCQHKNIPAPFTVEKLVAFLETEMAGVIERQQPQRHKDDAAATAALQYDMNHYNTILVLTRVVQLLQQLLRQLSSNDHLNFHHLVGLAIRMIIHSSAMDRSGCLLQEGLNLGILVFKKFPSTTRDVLLSVIPKHALHKLFFVLDEKVATSHEILDQFSFDALKSPELSMQLGPTSNISEVHISCGCLALDFLTAFCGGPGIERRVFIGSQRHREEGSSEIFIGAILLVVDAANELQTVMEMETTMAGPHVCRFEDAVKIALQVRVKNVLEIVMAALSFLLATVHGPCPPNQDFLCEQGIVKACSSLIAPWEEKVIECGWEIDPVEGRMVEGEHFAKVNIIKYRAGRLLNGLLEGRSEQAGAANGKEGSGDHHLFQTLAEQVQPWNVTLRIHKLYELQQHYGDHCELVNVREEGHQLLSIALAIGTIHSDFLRPIIPKKKGKRGKRMMNESMAMGADTDADSEGATVSEAAKEDMDLKEKMDKFRYSYTKVFHFFRDRVRKIEVDWNGKLTTVHFPLIGSCDYFSEALKTRFMGEIDLEADDRMKKLLSNAGRIFAEMQHLEYLAQFELYKKIELNFGSIRRTTLLITILLNVSLLLSLQKTYTSDGRTVMNEVWCAVVCLFDGFRWKIKCHSL
jgi:hypothetical protein